MSDFFNTTEIKAARKNHRCELCSKHIKIGESYFRQSGKWEGEFFDICLHPICDKIVGEYCSEVENEWDDDRVLEWIQNTICDYCDLREDCFLNEFECKKVLDHFKSEVPDG